jgi:pilus assembly protein TadC
LKTVVKVRDITAIVGFVVTLALGFFELTQPPETRRLSPLILFTIAALFAARIAARRQARKREKILKEVPERPLGLNDDGK